MKWPFRPLRYIMDPVKNFIHQLNAEAYRVNKNIISPTSSLQHVPLDKNIYNNPQSRPAPVPVPQPAVSEQPQNIQPIPTPVVSQTNLDKKDIESLVSKLISVEKKVDRFFNLIEKRVVKNAKEINIRIKLNEDSNTEQE